MSEQYPLLCEEPDEDKFSPRFQRWRPVTLRGRAKNHVKGAAAIMTRWPGNYRHTFVDKFVKRYSQAVEEKNYYY